MNLKFCVITAGQKCEEYRNPKIVMGTLGITYQHYTPQSLDEMFMFWNCEDVPENLPKFLTVQDWKPMDWVNFGLTKEQAEKIRDYENKT